jgi:hypothetical protein
MDGAVKTTGFRLRYRMVTSPWMLGQRWWRGVAIAMKQLFLSYGAVAIMQRKA